MFTDNLLITSDDSQICIFDAAQNFEYVQTLTSKSGEAGKMYFDVNKRFLVFTKQYTKRCTTIESQLLLPPTKCYVYKKIDKQNSDSQSKVKDIYELYDTVILKTFRF
eukprot:UN25488